MPIVVSAASGTSRCMLERSSGGIAAVTIQDLYHARGANRGSAG
jgi:hypothetical protein